MGVEVGSIDAESDCDLVEDVIGVIHSKFGTALLEHFSMGSFQSARNSKARSFVSLA